MQIFKDGEEWWQHNAVLFVGSLFVFVLLDNGDVGLLIEDDTYYHYKTEFSKDEFLNGVEFDAKKLGCSPAWKDDYELNYKIALFAHNLYNPLDK